MASIPPNQTLYIRNLNDKIQKEVLKHALYGLCIAYGRVLDIVALKTMKMRGQAFVAFDDITAATAALRQLNGRRIFGRPLQVEYALSKSNVVAQNDGSYRFNEPHKHMSAVERKRITDESSEEDDIGPAPPATNEDYEATRDNGDDEVSPSSTLFITNLPDNISIDVLAGLFQKYAGFQEVRPVPGKRNMAFVEYATVDSASAARNVLNGFKLSADQPMRVAFSR
ncbi:spliceosomal protein [Coemansia reversa NRRL 1564]|uniref:Spliceosomal protein n=1 Tax=Coemansia reversa (strain ATCC 12441 / NRRL 1564) TaxID=763665 RepID=A0A2G5BG93_COERN|nr:spliceosomal protein [Coemansia reversa NRRL 1564]|eukprot:PIA18021.1 spliceosomal protein [Coemansia reversa NRRL 1564]